MSPPTTTAGQLIRGSIFRNLELFILLGVTFGITPVIVHALGDRMYGFWTLVGSFIGYYGLLDFGLSSAAARYISQSLGRGDLEELNAVANTAFFLFCLVGLAALAATLLSVLACPLIMRDPADIALFRKIVLLLGVATAVGFPMRVYWGILASYLRYDIVAYVSIFRTLASNAAIYHSLGRGGGIMSVVVISFAASLAQHAVTYAVCASRFPQVRIVLFRYDSAKIRAMFDHSWKNFICQLGDIFRFKIDSLMIAGFLNVSLVTPYSLGVRIVDGFSQLVMSTVGMMQPVFSRYEGQGDYESMRGALLKITKVSALLSAYIGLSIIFYAKALIFRWMGPGFESSYYVAAILCVAFMIELPQSPGIQLLYGLSKHDVYAALNGCEAALNVILSLVLLRYFGMYGVVLGTAVEIVIIKLFVLPFYICRPIRLPVRVYLLDTMLATLFKTSAPLGLYFYLTRSLVLPDYGRLCACVAAQTLFFVPAAYLFVLSADERRFVKELAASALGRTAKKPGGINATA